MWPLTHFHGSLAGDVRYHLCVSVALALLLGAVQGLTEFLPISSDGHLVLVSLLLESPLSGRDALGFDIILHAGSLLALLIAYRRMWRDLVLRLLHAEAAAVRLVLLLVVATIPGVIAGLFAADAIGEMRSLRAAAVGFLVTGTVLLLGEWIGKRRPERMNAPERLSYGVALSMGVAQAIAILPGVSRSGSTISIGRALGLPRKVALDVSFLMAVPIIAGAVAKTALDARTGAVVFPSVSASIAGFGASLVVSLTAIALLRLVVARRSLAIFSWYVLPLGLLLLLFGS